MAYCGNCGAELRPGERRCAACGAPVRRKATARRRSRPVWQKWWVWLLALVALGALSRGIRGAARPETKSSAPPPAAVTAAPTPTVTPTPTPTTAPTETPAPTEPPALPEDGVRPELREFLESYEAFIDEYIAFLQKYAQSDPTEMVGMMGDYYSILARYGEFSEAIDALDASDMNSAELSLYLEVTNRVSQKLLSVAG